MSIKATEARAQFFALLTESRTNHTMVQISYKGAEFTLGLTEDVGRPKVGTMRLIRPGRTTEPLQVKPTPSAESLQEAFDDMRGDR